MSEARALTNLVGNGVATVVISRWENELDMDNMQLALNPGEVVEEDESDMMLEPLQEEF